MRLSLEWLSDHVDLAGLSPEAVGELYTMHVAECSVGDPWPGVVVGDVLAVRPHPDARKLRLVEVSAGGGGTLEVVCGAPNVAQGQKICFAPAGTTLPDGLVLEKRKIRGVVSAGMVLSERELGISDEHEGILVLDTDRPAGTPAREVLPGGRVLDVENTAITTRPDLWGHYGAARELAAILERPLRPLALGDPFPKGKAGVAVAVECEDLCPRYLGWAIGGLRVEPSPAWLQRRLEDAGQRPINNLVDLTNYIQLELGQPLHAFDRRQIVDGRIVVRRSRPDEKVVTLDGTERTLPPDCCVIADPERAVAIAGVMGLENSEVGDDTTEIILEVANFDSVSIRRTSVALDLRTESAVRFSKGLDPEGVPAAARRFLELLRQVCPTARPLGAPCDVRVPPAPERVIGMAEDFAPRRLGIALEPERQQAILERLGFGVARRDGGFTVRVPSWRAGNDVSLPEDLVEEVGRIHGYDKLPPVPLFGRLDPVPEEPEREGRRAAREALSGDAGLTEIFAYPFTTADECGRAGLEPGPLQLSNAEQPGLDLMVTSLVPRTARALGDNLKYRDEVALYLVAPVFLKEEAQGLPRENERVAIGVARRGGRHPVFAVKGAVEALLERLRVGGARVEQVTGGAVPPWLHPGRAARVGRGRQTFGWFGEVHPRVARAFDLDAPAALADLDLDLLRGASGRARRMQPISRYPTVKYDVAVVAERTTPAGDVEAALRRADEKLVREVRLFDVYEGKSLPAGTRSLAFRMVFGADDRTLSTEDVERLRASVSSILAKRGWTLRV